MKSRILYGMAIGLALGPLVVACLGALYAGRSGGIPMVSIPNYRDALVAGFVYSLLLFGIPAAWVGTAIGGVTGALTWWMKAGAHGGKGKTETDDLSDSL